MTDILLTNPSYSFTDLVKLKSKKKSKGFYVNYPPLGLGYLASSARKAGYSVVLVDGSAELLSENELVKKIKLLGPKIVGILVTTQTSPVVFSLIKKIKKQKNPPEIIVGGPHISAIPETIKWIGVKYGFIGEGERGLIKLLQYLFEKKGSLKNIEGLVRIDKGKVVVNPNYPITDLDSLPFPARDLLNNERYFSPVHGGRITSMLSSRGCPFHCAYCSRPAIGRQLRFRSPANIMQEIEEVINDFGVVYIEFVDDLFTFDKERIIKLCDLIIKKKLKINWGCQTRADQASYRLLKKMKKAGCEKVSFGLESGVEHIRYGINKRIPDKSFIRASAWCHKLGIETNIFVMFGHPNEKLSDMKQSIDFTKKLDPDYASFYITTVLPGSTLGENIKNKVWKDYLSGKGQLPIYRPAGISTRDLEEMHRRAFREFYIRPSYFLKRLLKIRSYHQLKNTVRSGLAVIYDFILK